MGNTYNRVYIWCCKYGENRYCGRCANKKWCASKHTGLLNSCLGKICLHPYLVLPLISARVTLIFTRVSAQCRAILLYGKNVNTSSLYFHTLVPENPVAMTMSSLAPSLPQPRTITTCGAASALQWRQNEFNAIRVLHYYTVIRQPLLCVLTIDYWSKFFVAFNLYEK